MTRHQYRAALVALDLTQRAAGELLGYSLRTSQDYARGITPVPRSVALLLALLLNGVATIKQLEHIKA